jgi:hypothetical protein
MEWVLQVVDEIDDAIGAARHRWLGFSAQINVLVLGIGALVAAVARTLTMRGTLAMRGRLRARS